MSVRPATHAGSWYSSDKQKLSGQLDGWLSEVKAEKSPIPRARVIIAPHAGYSYSGPTAAWAYSALDVSKANRVFLLGPSHHMYLDNCALSKSVGYATPLGDLKVDQQMTSELHDTGKFGWMSSSTDADEHSLELHLPYIYKVLSRSFQDLTDFPPIVPILVGSTSPTTEKEYGELLAPYLANPEHVFVISSDFAHWGQRFRYTYYLPTLDAEVHEGTRLKSSARGPFKEPKIYESIEKVDKACISAIESGRHDSFVGVLNQTGNTVCGQHPIGVVMAAMEVLGGKKDARFSFTRYTRSSDCIDLTDSSVSYASGYAVL